MPAPILWYETGAILVERSITDFGVRLRILEVALSRIEG
jgi:hypothetical protein